MNKIIILQSKQLTESINSGVLDKLYRYALQSKVEDPSYNLTMQLLGNVTPIAAYLDAVDYLTEKFPDLIINEPTKGYYVRFKDSVVESIIFNNLVNVIYPNKYEGVIVSLELNNSGNENLLGFKLNFRNNQDITSFDELSLLVNVKALANEEFRDCHNLESIDLTKIEYLGQNCFRSSYNLEYFNGKNSEIGTLSMPNLKYNGLSKGGAFYCWKDGDVYRGPRIKRILDLGDCTIIGGETFMLNTQLEYVAPEVFEKLTKIGTNVFNACENLVIEDLKLPNITEIGGSAFRNTKVKTISELGSSCTILDNCFVNCTQLTTISSEALANISVLKAGAFNGCTNLVIEDLSLPNLTSIGGDTFRNTKVKIVSNLGNISTVTGFRDCSLLTSIVIPLTADTFGESAFAGCVNLKLPNLSDSNISLFYPNCLSGITSLPTVLYLPKVNISIGYTAFNNTNVRSLYLPNLKHTNGVLGTSVPTPHSNTHRGNSYILRCGSTMNILYLKNINKINSGIFGARYHCDILGFYLTTDLYYNWKNTETEYRHIVDNTCIWEYDGDLPIPFGDENTPKLDWESITYSNIKYLIINNINPPKYWGCVLRYGDITYGALGIWGRTDLGDKLSFKYLAVPRSAINTYRNWIALKPDFNLSVISSTNREKMEATSHFNLDNIIAIESMPHFATKAEYDASDITNKDDYLIEEYMGLADGETINWDATPTQYS